MIDHPNKYVLHYEANADESDDEGLIFEYEAFGKVLRFNVGYDRDGPSATVTAYRNGEEAAVGVTGFNGDIIVSVDFVKDDDLL